MFSSGISKSNRKRKPHGETPQKIILNHFPVPEWQPRQLNAQSLPVATLLSSYPQDRLALFCSFSSYYEYLTIITYSIGSCASKMKIK
jgi:hypothetical protein